MSDHSALFRTGLKGIARGEILAPPLRAYLADPDFRSFTLEIRGMGKRAYDGKFHPSTHPGWNVRSLWLYLVAPGLLVEEPLEHSALLAMTAGSIWHAIIERSLLELNLLVTNEVQFEDPSTRSIGKADGLVKEHSGQDSPEELFEFKTMRDLKLAKTESVEHFIEKNPGYYLQALEYMRMSGYRKMRFLLMALTFPFEMREFVIEYDFLTAERAADRYRLAIQHAADRTVPMCDGCRDSVFCPARAVCKSATPEQMREWMS